MSPATIQGDDEILAMKFARPVGTLRFQRYIHPDNLHPTKVLNLPRWIARSRHLLHAAATGVMGLAYPPRCSFCDTDIDATQNGVLLCRACMEDIGEFRPHVCPRCAAPAPAIRNENTRCIHCEKTNFRFDGAFAIGAYQHTLREAVLKIKQPRQEPLTFALANLLTEEILKRGADQPPRSNWDIVAAVPMHPWRRMWRGVNTVDLLARRIARRLNIRFKPRTVRCTRQIERQSTLAPTERFKNVKNAYRVKPKRYLNQASVLLIDDILTTGATASEIARRLKEQGAERVDVAVLARGIGAQ